MIRIIRQLASVRAIVVARLPIYLMAMHILLTGAAGFIGFHLARRLLADGQEVTGIDSLSDYYDVRLKRDRLAQIGPVPGFSFIQADLSDASEMAGLFKDGAFDAVVNLAAQAGVRYSLQDPQAYVSSNLTGFVNVLEGCRHSRVPHLIFASSSSVYGANTRLPFSVRDNVDHPLSLYAATKKANELMAHSYSNLYGLPVTGLRFFTVYGPWGRPDMAMFRFAEAILHDKPIQLYNGGKMRRDFTYIDDVVEGIVRLLAKPPRPALEWNGLNPDPATSFAPYRLYNIGNSQPVDVLDVITLIERHFGRTAKKEMLPMQPGDVPATFADIAELSADVGFSPKTPIEVGVKRFLEWYSDYTSKRAEPILVRG